MVDIHHCLEIIYGNHSIKETCFEPNNAHHQLLCMSDRKFNEALLISIIGKPKMTREVICTPVP